MKGNRVQLETALSYPIYIGNQWIHQMDEAAVLKCAGVGSGGRVIAVVDKQVHTRHLDRLRGVLGTSAPLTIEGGEQAKTLSQYAALIQALERRDVSAGDVVLAVGGGTIGDLVGFAASTFLRGVPIIHVPTTVVACVDSSIGGKTGINSELGKNRLGSFYNPQAVWMDTAFLATLPQVEWTSGMGEVIKYALGFDRTLWAMLSEAPVAGTADERFVHILARCVRLKADIVHADPRDCGLRRRLNFGHTLGHALERVSAYTLPHGHAVALGMCAMVALADAYRHRGAPQCEREQIETVIAAHGLPTSLRAVAALQEMDIEALRGAVAQAIRGDKKRSGDALSLIVYREIGRVEVQTWPLEMAIERMVHGMTAII